MADGEFPITTGLKGIDHSHLTSAAQNASKTTGRIHCSLLTSCRRSRKIYANDGFQATVTSPRTAIIRRIADRPVLAPATAGLLRTGHSPPSPCTTGIGRELSPCGSARERPLCQIRSPQPARRRPAQYQPSPMISLMSSLARRLPKTGQAVHGPNIAVRVSLRGTPKRAFVSTLRRRAASVHSCA